MAQRTLKRILLVEDDPDIHTVTSMALGSFGGYNVHVCGSAMEAIAAAAEFLPDLILLDVMMPDMDGLDALRGLRQIPATASSVIFPTARVQPAEVARYKELDSLAVVRKPFEPTALVDTIQDIWSRHRDQTH